VRGRGKGHVLMSFRASREGDRGNREWEKAYRISCFGSEKRKSEKGVSRGGDHAERGKKSPEQKKSSENKGARRSPRRKRRERKGIDTTEKGEKERKKGK